MRFLNGYNKLMNFDELKLKYQKQPVIEYAHSVIPTPLVSVCVQTYQQASYIKECIEGILMQKTTFPFEILLGEDDSSDKTREICIEYAKNYPDIIRLFLHDRANVIYISGNPTGRFNFLYNLSQARGKYIALCEGDDYWTDPLKLQKQVDFLQNSTEFSACFTNAQIINEFNGQKYLYHQKNLKNGKVSKEKIVLTGGFIYPTATLVFKGNFLNSIPFNNLQSYFAGDTLLIYVLAIAGNVFYDDTVTTVYRKWSGGIYSSIGNNREEIIELKKKEIVGLKLIRHDVDDNNAIKKRISVNALFILKYGKFHFDYLRNLRFIDFFRLVRFRIFKNES